MEDFKKRLNDTIHAHQKNEGAVDTLLDNILDDKNEERGKFKELLMNLFSRKDGKFVNYDVSTMLALQQNVTGLSFVVGDLIQTMETFQRRDSNGMACISTLAPLLNEINTNRFPQTELLEQQTQIVNTTQTLIACAIETMQGLKNVNEDVRENKATVNRLEEYHMENNKKELEYKQQELEYKQQELEYKQQELEYKKKKVQLEEQQQDETKATNKTKMDLLKESNENIDKHIKEHLKGVNEWSRNISSGNNSSNGSSSGGLVTVIAASVAGVCAAALVGSGTD
jgi:vacuolar-type H+-ATPase subunit I/STV1